MGEHMDIRSAIFLSLSLLLISPAKATIIYENWVTNGGESGNYIFTIEHDEINNQFQYNFTVDPWNAEGLGVFIDLGDVTMPANIGLTSVSPANQVQLWATDTTSDRCGTGCNLNGLNLPLDDPDGEWELVFRLGSQGWNNIQTFSWMTDDFGFDDLSHFGLVGVRSQQLCPEGSTLPDGNCKGSDKSYGYSSGVPIDPQVTTIPEPSSVFFLGLGLIGLGLARRKQFN